LFSLKEIFEKYNILAQQTKRKIFYFLLRFSIDRFFFSQTVLAKNKKVKSKKSWQKIKKLNPKTKILGKK